MADRTTRGAARSKLVVLILTTACACQWAIGPMAPEANAHSRQPFAVARLMPARRPPGASQTPKPVNAKLPSLKGIHSKQVIACMRRGHLTHISRSASYLWVGWVNHVGIFVYTQLYASVDSARAAAKLYSKLETGIAGRLVVSEHIAPYWGSPVPAIVKCLHGRMVSKAPKKPGSFTF